MNKIIKSVSGEAAVTATTAEEMKADILERVEQMYDYVKDAGDDLKIKRFSCFLDNMMKIAGAVCVLWQNGNHKMSCGSTLLFLPAEFCY